MDVFLHIKGKEKGDFQDLQILHDYLKPRYDKCFIIQASTPIIKLVDAETGISFDIQNSTSDGLETTKFIRKQLQLYPEIQPITLVLK